MQYKGMSEQKINTSEKKMTYCEIYQKMQTTEQVVRTAHY